MNTPLPQLTKRLLRIAGLAGLAIGPALAAAPFVQSSHDAYFPGEEIQFVFRDGPGNAKDWIGVYPVDVVPGSTGSTIWRYVDNTQGGNQGLAEGAVTFPTGLNLAGDWAAYFLLNDGYTQLATNLFKVVEPGTPVVRVDKRRYLTGESITVAFTNGPAGTKDWIGIYKAGQTPGGPTSTLWAYVDGTQAGTVAKAEGTITFPSGLAQGGDWVVHFMVNDGYDIIASETFSVEAPAAVVPRILSLNPSNGSTNLQPNLEFSATITNGTSKVVASTVELLVDGAAVVPEVTSENGLVRVRYAASTLAPSLSEHTWALSFKDDATPANTVRAETRGTVRAYRNIVLSDPVVFENFDAVPEGSLPAGWTEKGYSTPLNEAIDFGDLGSAAYRTWTTVESDRFKGTFVTYANTENPASWGEDYRRVLSANPANVVNGAIFSGPFAKGRFLFGNSGYQNGAASQVVYLFTPDFDLRGKTNVHLGFNSLWEQNQDSIAAIEYSIDGGQAWLPVAYFLATADIVTVSNEVTGEITVDAEATLNTEHSDVARYTDEQGNEIGGTYGAFIAAPITPALAPYIQGRVDDNPVESKRVEWFRLPAADNQARVRLRFAHAGTDSWYFGIDDFGIYAPTAASGPAPALTVNRTGQELTLSWPASATGYVLESTTSLKGGTWQAVPGVSGNSHKVDVSGGSRFFRLKK
ncbi:MAG: hypothetical protein JNL97_15350 [Verrucomicrobiales bacterium]|nr:hypothetical protein [Verrucomicrobiales bacterium]